jgi:maltose alpha-D-glucosyltransferase/alpha-amylase
MVQVPIGKGPFATSRVNVEDQKSDPDSLLSRVKRMIALRRKHGVGSARLLPLPVEKPAVFAHAAIGETETLLAVHNLSGKTVRVDVPLEDIKETHWVDLGSGECQAAERGKLKLSLPAHNYRWFAAGQE